MLLLALLSPSAILAAEPRLTETDAKAIRFVVQAQIDAIAVDDGPKAFSYASEGIRAQFGIPEVFMAMVREGYPVVYRPASVRFLPAYRERDEFKQPVRMTDGNGLVWVALYRLEKHRNGSWRIAGCSLARTAGTST
ncbi:MAG: DUF4864 domain-containing protein [Candidatus Parcubacteria bacterium]|nr:DUF4864 domain-containing protein [Burkholderiales bacterium]